MNVITHIPNVNHDKIRVYKVNSVNFLLSSSKFILQFHISYRSKHCITLCSVNQKNALFMLEDVLDTSSNLLDCLHKCMKNIPYKIAFTIRSS